MMKKILKHIFYAVLIFLLTLLLLFSLWMLVDPVCAVLSGVIDGNIYRKAGSITLQYEQAQVTVPVYKAKGKPFLLLGPHIFYPPDTDFLFVSQNMVVASATDKGGDCWIIIGNCLFMLDDMTCKDRVRLPFWELLEQKISGVGVRGVDGCREYRVVVGNGRKLTFRIPEQLFTLDMPPAEPYLDLHCID